MFDPLNPRHTYCFGEPPVLSTDVSLRLSRVLSALLISDIHFRRNERLGTPDRDIELRNGLLQFLPELRERLPDISLVLVCGDVAYQAVEHEYALAKEFLRDVQAALRGARVLVVPGNHDIDREAARTADQRAWRSSLRSATLSDDQREAKLMDFLNDVDAGPGLFEPLAAYNKFAADYGCDISVSEPSPFWNTLIPLSDRYQAEIRGMTSVLISDSHDNSGPDRLLLGEFQAADLVPGGKPGVLSITLCHHPYPWLFDGTRQKQKLRHRSALHITGHDHQHEIVRNAAQRSIHLCAGALQPTRDGAWAPRLYGLSFDVQETETSCSASVVIVSAIWDRDADKFVIDVDEREEINLKCADTEAVVEAPAHEIARLTERYGALQPADRLSVALEVGVNLGSLADGPPHEIPQRVIDHARDQNLLHILWERVELRHGQQTGANPFEEL